MVKFFFSPSMEVIPAEGRLSASNAAADLQNLGLSVAGGYVEIVGVEADAQVVGREVLQREARHAFGAEFAAQHHGLDH